MKRCGRKSFARCSRPGWNRTIVAGMSGRSRTIGPQDAGVFATRDADRNRTCLMLLCRQPRSHHAPAPKKVAAPCKRVTNCFSDTSGGRTHRTPASHAGRFTGFAYRAVLEFPELKCLCQESNLIFDLRKVACGPTHSRDRSQIVPPLPVADTGVEPVRSAL